MVHHYVLIVVATKNLNPPEMKIGNRLVSDSLNLMFVPKTYELSQDNNIESRELMYQVYYCRNILSQDYVFFQQL